VNHNLNLALSDAAATLHIVRNLDAIQKLLVYLTGSAKRSEVFRENIKKHVPHSNRTSIAQLAPTRWTQRHETLIAFEELFPAVLAALKELDKDEKTNQMSLDLIKLCKNLFETSWICIENWPISTISALSCKGRKFRFSGPIKLIFLQFGVRSRRETSKMLIKLVDLLG
jgi:hypothetical protein